MGWVLFAIGVAALVFSIIVLSDDPFDVENDNRHFDPVDDE